MAYKFIYVNFDVYSHPSGGSYTHVVSLGRHLVSFAPYKVNSGSPEYGYHYDYDYYTNYTDDPTKLCAVGTSCPITVTHSQRDKMPLFFPLGYFMVFEYTGNYVIRTTYGDGCYAYSDDSRLFNPDGSVKHTDGETPSIFALCPSGLADDAYDTHNSAFTWYCDFDQNNNITRIRRDHVYLDRWGGFSPQSSYWQRSVDAGYVLNYFNSVPDVPRPSEDPYDGGGIATTGGGTGNFDATSDTITIPSLPSLSVTDTGFMTLFSPSLANLQALSAYLWNNAIADIISGTISDKVEALKMIVANPYDALMGLSMVPVSVSTGASKEIKMYGIIETGLNFPTVSSQYVTVDCGTLNVNEFWGAYLDYSPYTKVTSLYLPYIGVVSVDTDMIMGKALQVVYHVDVLSGQCVAYIVIDGSVEFQYQGHCATTIPITNADYTGAIQSGLNLIGSVTNIGASIGTGLATGGAGGAIMGAVSGVASQGGAIANAVMGSKPDIKSGGGVGSMGGIMSVQKPYLIIERPRQCMPQYQNEFTGYPSNVTAILGTLQGYTEVESVFVENMSATEAEREEIKALLIGGVIL